MPKLLKVLALLLLLCILTSTANAATYVYDDLGRLKTVIYNNGQQIDYTYDVGGNLLTVKSNDVKPPMVSYSDPEDGTTKFEVDKTIKINFNETISEAVYFQGIVLKNTSNNTTVDYTYNFNNNVLTILPLSNLDYNTTYLLVVPAGAVKDNAGNKLVSSYNIDFTTEPHPDTVAPTVYQTSPSDKDVNIPISQNISINFSEEVVASDNIGGIELKAGSTIAEYTYSINNNILTIGPVNDLDYSVNYTVYIPAGAIKDIAGNAFANDYTYSFTTEPQPDTVSPTVYSTTPPNNAVDIPLDQNITINFSEDISTGANVDAIALKTGDTVVDFTYSINGSELTLNPANDLANGTNYTVVIPAGAVKDSAGNTLPSDYDFNFTTSTVGDQNTFSRPTPAYKQDGSRVNAGVPRYEAGASANMVTNGNFADQSGWEAAGGEYSVSDNTLTLTGDGTFSSPVIYQDTGLSIPEGHKVYIQFKMRVTNPDCSLMFGELRDGEWWGSRLDCYPDSGYPTQDGWETLSDIGVVPAGGISDLVVVLKNTYADAATANGKTMQVKEVMLIDLTKEFGAGNEPNLEQCDAYFAQWDDGANRGITIEEGTTNLIPQANQKFEGWTAYDGASVTVTQDQTVTEWNATDATRIQTSGGTSNLKYYLNLDPSINGQRYSHSVWVKNVGTSTLRIQENIWGRYVDILPGEQKRVELEDSVGNGTTYVLLQFSTINVEDSLDFIAWRPQVEKKANCTSWIDGTRAGETLRIPTPGVLSPAEGTWEQTVYIGPNQKDNLRYIFAIPNGSNAVESLVLQHSDDANEWQLISRDDAGNETTMSTSDAITPDGWHEFGVIWTQSTVKLFIDGDLQITLTNPKLPSSFGSNAYVGTSCAGDSWINSITDDLCISSIARSDADMQLRGASVSPLLADSFTTLKMNFDNSLSETEMTALNVDGTNPPNNATEVSVDEAITVTLSENVQQSVNFNNITLNAGENAVGVTCSISGNTITILPDADLDYSTTYTLTVPADAVKGISDNILANIYSFNFTTDTAPEDVAAPTNVNLSSITLSNGLLTPLFSADTTTYVTTVDNNITSVTVTPVSEDSNTTTSVNGTTVVSGQISAPIPLSVGVNEVYVTVNSQDGTTSKTYVVRIIRLANADLSGLIVKAGVSTVALTPSFNTNIVSYSASVANTIPSVKITPVVADVGSTVSVNGTSVISGQSVTVALVVGSNPINVTVVAQDGTTKTYTVTVNWQ